MSDKQPPFVIHVNEMPDHPGAVYIGRAMPRRGLRKHMLANPFTVKEHGRAGAIEKYREWIYGYVGSDTHEEGELLWWLKHQDGKPLACWCRRSDEPRTNENMCHGDVLVELWEEANS